MHTLGMDSKLSVKYVLEAIESVKLRATSAYLLGNSLEYKALMGDLLALESCLVGEAKKLVEDLDKEAA